MSRIEEVLRRAVAGGKFVDVSVKAVGDMLELIVSRRGGNHSIGVPALSKTLFN